MNLYHSSTTSDTSKNENIFQNDVRVLVKKRKNAKVSFNF